MKRFAAWGLATVSGLYVLAGPIPDPLPLVDEAFALWIFVKTTTYLGYDVRGWIPFLRKRKRLVPRNSNSARNRTVDV